MAPNTQTFIPKKTSEETVRRRSIGFFSLIAWIVFILSLLASVGVFAYEKVVQSSLERKKADLERARAAFEPTLIEELARLDERLVFAQEVVDRHVAPSRFLESLEDVTVQNVRFRNLSYSHTDTGISVNMEGEARSFNAIAVQSDLFGDSNFFHSPIFSGLNLNQVGNVTFSFSGILDPSNVLYVPRSVATFNESETINDVFDMNPMLDTETATGSPEVEVLEEIEIQEQ